jgi:hypothetical protein
MKVNRKFELLFFVGSDIVLPSASNTGQEIRSLCWLALRDSSLVAL